MPWHTEPNQDLESRRQMINLIANYLEKRHPRTDNPDALVSTARKLEVALYKASKTKQEYMETRTLQNRIRDLERSGNFAIDSTNTASANSNSNTALSNGSTSSNNTGATNSITAIHSSATLQANGVNSGVSGSTVTQSVASATAQHQEVLKQRRNRLLLLKHASKCTYEEGKCPNHWCPQMKKLWQHVSQCKIPDCTVPHCVSSHYVLTHYHRCQDKNCVVCQPVRDERRRALEAANASGNSGYLRSTLANRISQPLIKSEPNQMEALGLRRAENTPPNVSNAIDPRFARGSKDGTGPSLPLSMTKQAVEEHLDSLKVEQMQQILFPLLRKLMENTKLNGGIFNEPVDAIALNIPEYNKVITKPMDFGTVRRRLDDGRYRKISEFETDVRQVLENATKFNPPEHAVHQMAIQLKHFLEAELKKVRQKLAEPAVQKKAGECPLCKQDDCEKCVLCERGCMAYEPKILYCAGTCGQRINRNATFYSQPGTALSWCSDCHDRRRENFVTDISTGTSYNKSELVKRKHDELFGEPWVCCDACGRWAHQTCALFNGRKQNPQNKEDRYTCPKCMVKTDFTPSGKVPGAEDLEHTRLSKFLEMWVRAKLTDALVQEKQNPPKIRGDDPPPASAVHIRVLSNFDETFKTKDLAKNIAHAPEALQYRSRAIFLFQHLDGVDVLLFVMYVQEYGSDAPPPNRGKVYIAYLDSVHFFRPRHYRTLVYHELLLAYLEYARRQGFTSCYIWACPPPTKKDDYILHCHPEDQRVPSHERLRMWYHEMIKRGAAERIVLSSCALFEEHYESSFKKLAPNAKKKEGTRRGGPMRLNSGKAGNNEKKIENAEAISRALALSSNETKSTTPPAASGTPGAGMFDEDDDNNLDDINFEDDIGNSLTPAPSGATVAGGSSSIFSVATPRRAGTPALIDDAPLFLGLRKHDLDAFDSEELERRRNHKLATRFQMPMFDGDYWPNEFEDVALDFAKKVRDSKPGATRPAAAQNTAIYSGNLDADGKQKARNGKIFGADSHSTQQLIASGDASQVDLAAVMNRIGESLEHMRADFLVVKLAHECSVCGTYLLRGRWECRHPECLQAAGFNRPSPFALCDACFLLEINKSPEKQHGATAQLARPPVVATPSLTSSQQDGTENTESETKKETDDDETTGGSENEEKASLKKGSENWDKQPLGCTRLVPEKAAGATPTHQLCFVDERLPLKTPRTDKTFRNHLLDTRHAFLSLCTGNRYAFNQLRRAKHSTMMILYHLHNPEAPAHLHFCNMCGSDIISGYRYNCQLCQGGDFDLCQACALKAPHPHKLVKIEVTNTVDQDVSESKRKKGIEQRRQRQRSLQVFLAALVHASSCQAEPGECNEVACAKMKELLVHRNSCRVRVRGGCEICRRVLCLVQMHARGTDQQPGCNQEHCPVPHCDDLKKHLRQKEETAAALNAQQSLAPGSGRGRGNGSVSAGANIPPAEGRGRGKKRQKGDENGLAVVAPASATSKRQKQNTAATLTAVGLPSAPLKIKIKVSKPTGTTTSGGEAVGQTNAFSSIGDSIASTVDSNVPSAVPIEEKPTNKRARLSTTKGSEGGAVRKN